MILGGIQQIIKLTFFEVLYNMLKFEKIMNAFFLFYFLDIFIADFRIFLYWTVAIFDLCHRPQWALSGPMKIFLKIFIFRRDIFKCT